MQIQLIRNATLRMEYAHRRFIIDPYLAAKHTRPSYAGTSPNPLVDLLCSPQEAIAGIEMALISHLHYKTARSPTPSAPNRDRGTAPRPVGGSSR